jgi:alpha-N-arabinofuranosidase
MKMKKRIILLLLAASCTLSAKPQAANRIVVSADMGKDTISAFIYGHFAEHLGACIYGGIWVGEDSPIPNTRGVRNDVAAALREIKPAVIRWPGGCFGDTYHWMDGIGPRESRPSIVNSTWGGVTEDNSFGTHEFLDFCGQVGAEPYIALNVGSGTVREAADWVEYVNSDAKSPMTELRQKNGREKPWNVKFWAVGNENWGCGGNMTPEYYSDLFRRFATYMRAGKLYRVASGGTDPDVDWTETVMERLCNNPHNNIRSLIQGYSFHYYTFARGWNDKTSATRFGAEEWFDTMKQTWIMQERLENHIRIMDQYDPANEIGVIADEWGNWFDVEPGTNPAFLYQQNTVRDAVTAALYLNIFNNHCRRVKMANLAQTVNVLQSVILTRGPEMVRTPTFYVMKMFSPHQNAVLLPVETVCEPLTSGGRSVPGLSASASADGKGRIHLSLANIDPLLDKEVVCELRGAGKRTRWTGEILTGRTMNAFNDFGKPEEVRPAAFDGFKVSGNTVSIRLPARSVVMLEME